MFGGMEELPIFALPLLTSDGNFWKENLMIRVGLWWGLLFFMFGIWSGRLLRIHEEVLWDIEK